MSLAVTISNRELETKCLQLQRRGLSHSQIAADLSMTPKRVGQIIRRALSRAEFNQELEIDIQRKTVIGRIDELISVYYGLAVGEEPRVVKLTTGEEIVVKSPSIEAAKLIRDLDKSRRELLGLDAQTKKEQGGNVQVMVTYVSQDKSPAAPEPAITVDYSEVKCLPEAEEKK